MKPKMDENKTAGSKFGCVNMFGTAVKIHTEIAKITKGRGYGGRAIFAFHQVG
jgi:hypothetical protein